MNPNSREIRYIVFASYSLKVTRLQNRIRFFHTISPTMISYTYFVYIIATTWNYNTKYYTSMVTIRFYMSIFYKSAYDGKPTATERQTKVSVLIGSR